MENKTPKQYASKQMHPCTATMMLYTVAQLFTIVPTMEPDGKRWPGYMSHRSTIVVQRISLPYSIG